MTVGAQSSCVESSPLPFQGMGTVELQPYFTPVLRRDLMAAVNTTARSLGLRAASVVVLDALLSCLPCRDNRTGRDGLITPATLLTVYAANDTLCFRARGITDRQLRRHLERLEDAGLIRRRDSANGKRFPIKQGGKIIGAFGIDLSPLLARSRELFDMAEHHRQQKAELRGLRARLQKLCAECLALTDDAETLALLDAARNSMRRVGATVAIAREMIGRLSAVLSELLVRAEDCNNQPRGPECQHTQTGQRTASAGQNVRHKEPVKPDTKETGQGTDRWFSMTHIVPFFPDPPRDLHSLQRILFDFGTMLGMRASTLSQAVVSLGLIPALEALNRIAGLIDDIIHPDAYLLQLVAANRGHTAPHRKQGSWR
ncbi:helix-turn-helix domain-containing protein [Oceanicola sp. 22II-s10i]|uniref:helix-turn-helix domain-containing protein n=1 Tax=Oceanicola sp. 22II-s10i TaxID=1317116 RepID=UPI000B51EA53|nr:helix-turn-helix domain-containing protein [Oceanicola sp. 22II-s10i]